MTWFFLRKKRSFNYEYIKAIITCSLSFLSTGIVVCLYTQSVCPLTLYFDFVVSVDAMFNSMSDCQALHPDEQDTDSEADGRTLFTSLPKD